MNDIITALGQSNPIPDPIELIDTPEGKALAMRRPNSVIDWYEAREAFEGDGYRIRHVGSQDWEVSHRGKVLRHTARRSSAFSVVERHRREALWRRDMAVRLTVALLAIAALVVLAEFAEVPGLWFVGLLVIGIGFAATMRFLSVLNRNVDDPYRRLLPWERVSWRQRLRSK